MPSESEHATIVLAGIIPQRKDLLEKAQVRLTEEHFVEPIHRTLFNLLNRYFQVNSSVITGQALEDLTRKLDVGKRQLYKDTYVALEQLKVTDADFLWSVDQLRERITEKKQLEIYNTSVEILTKGITDKQGNELQGAHDSKSYLQEKLAELDRNLSIQESPEGDVREEGKELLAEYAENKRATLEGTARGIEFGIESVDEVTGGMVPGDLCLVAAYSNAGKSSLAIQTAWHAAIKQGKNVVILTTETTRPVMRRKILARHSKLPVFGIPDGLNTRDLKRGTLTENQEVKLKEVINDLSNNPDYGKLHIAQVPRGASVAECEQHLYRLEREFQIDLVVWDYLALMTSSARRNTDREILGGIIKEAKQVATTFADGRGVPILSPWQVNRQSHEKAENLGMYNMSALSETHEATATPDTIISMLNTEMDSTSRYAELMIQVLKQRDGETANDLLVDVDYATCTFVAKQSVAQFERAATLPSDVDNGGLASIFNM